MDLAWTIIAKASLFVGAVAGWILLKCQYAAQTKCIRVTLWLKVSWTYKVKARTLNKNSRADLTDPSQRVPEEITCKVYRNDPKFSDWYSRPGRTVQTHIRLLLEEQTDQGLHCLQFNLASLRRITLYGKASLFKFYDDYSKFFGCPNF